MKLQVVFSSISVILVIASTIQAQGFNPYGVGGQPNPWLQNNQNSMPYYGPQVGTLPNGTPIHNPWRRYSSQPIVNANLFNYQVNYNTQSILNPSLYPSLAFNNYRSTYFNNGYTQFGINQFNSGYANYGYYPQYEREVGTFVPVNPQLALNPYSGTILNPIRGIALTREGPFYRVPGTGSISPWGNYIPGSGVYVNPFTGAAYNPLTGIIAR